MPRPDVRRLLAVLVLAFASAFGAAAHGAPVTLNVAAVGALPGFAAQDASAFLAARMGEAGAAGFAFAPATGADAPDRVEWRIEQGPYAAGGIRQFAPIPTLQRLFGPRRLIVVEARLYLGGQYQTLASGEVAVQGGERDAELAAFVHTLTQNLLGPHGAYRSIELAPAARP